jgi:hypothetical protein
MQKYARILLLSSFLLNAFLIYKFINHHYININHVQYVDTRLNVYIETRDCGRNFAKIQNSFPNAMSISDEPCAHNEHVFKTYIQDIDKDNSRYAYKYIETLKICMQGDKMLCMVLEDDVLLIHKNETTWNNIALNTLSLLANEDTFWDCSTRKLWFSRGPNRERSLCRVYNTERLPNFIKCMESYISSIPSFEEEGIGALIKKCQVDLKIMQKHFLLVNQSGQRSLLGHQYK